MQTVWRNICRNVYDNKLSLNCITDSQSRRCKYGSSRHYGKHMQDILDFAGGSNSQLSFDFSMPKFHVWFNSVDGTYLPGGIRQFKTRSPNHLDGLRCRSWTSSTGWQITTATSTNFIILLSLSHIAYIQPIATVSLMAFNVPFQHKYASLTKKNIQHKVNIKNPSPV